MSIKLWDNYNNGGPTTYGTVLEIYGLGGHQTSQLYFGGWDNSRIRYREAFYAQNTWSDWITMLDSKNDIESTGNLKVTGNANSYILNGNVGIGTTAPSSKLEIYNTAQAGHLLLTANDNPNADATRIDIDFRVANQGHTVGRIASSYDTSANGGSGALRFYTRNQGNLTENVRINNIGSVGIGTTSPDEKLTVKGKIHAQEVKVDMLGPLVPDYVFANDYKLKSLQEVEAFIKKNSHLPEIPSAQELEKNGLMLAEMNMNLLKKVEELMLYMIDQNKKMDLQQKENAIQSKQIEEQNNKILNLEKKMNNLK
jgi:hypothetical protein